MSFKAEYHQSIPLPIPVLEEIDRERRTYAVTATLQYFKELPTVADNPVWGKDSDSDDHYTKHQNNATKKSRGDVKFIESLCEVVALTWGFHVFDPECNHWCTCPCSTSLQPWREKNNIDLDGMKECNHEFFSPRALMAHLKEKGDNDYHLATRHSLEILYPSCAYGVFISSVTARRGVNNLANNRGVATKGGAADKEIPQGEITAKMRIAVGVVPQGEQVAVGVVPQGEHRGVATKGRAADKEVPQGENYLQDEVCCGSGPSGGTGCCESGPSRGTCIKRRKGGCSIRVSSGYFMQVSDSKSRCVRQRI